MFLEEGLTYSMNQLLSREVILLPKEVLKKARRL